MDQIKLHKKIDDLIMAGPSCANFENVNKTISINEDARAYFFSKADEEWLKWLWENGFLDVIKQKAQDDSQFSYTIPELQYLVNVSEKDPSGVMDIMLDVPISGENFNPEVLNRFVWICGSLPADQVSRIVPKIKKENWVKLMKNFNSFGFEYEKMFEKLHEKKDWDNFLALAEVVLSIRSKEELKGEKYGTENPFYFRDLGQIKLFEYLIDIDEKNSEKALSLISGVMGKIVSMQDKEWEGNVFEISDSFGLYDVDFFTLNLDDEKHLSYRDDVNDIAAALKVFSVKTIGNKNLEEEYVKSLYKNHIETLPSSRAMWRFRLFALTLRPEIFKDKLKDSFFEIFNHKDEYGDLISGTEYIKSLKIGFLFLDDADKRKYVELVLELFSQPTEDLKEVQWQKYKCYQIFSSIIDNLTKDEVINIEKFVGKKLNEDFEPEPVIVSGGMAGMVTSKAPTTKEELQKRSITEIVNSLSNEWTPKNLREMDTEKDFMNPLNADGMGMLLKGDIAQRFGEYIDNAELFFNRGILDEHYTYSFLQGVCDVLRKNTPEEEIKLEKLLNLIESIIESNSNKKFSIEKRARESFDSWVADWKSVHYVTADVIKELLGEGKDKALIDFSIYRENLLNIIRYLLSYPSPTMESNAKENGSDPFSVAINSVRGRAFQALVLFIYRDGEKFSEDKVIKIDEDVKDIYEKVLDNEDTFAIMFLYGHYLSTFYYRDKEWIKGLIVKIFTEDANKKDLYMAAWEGYISANIYGDMFNTDDFQKLYERAVKINPEDYTKRKYFRGLDEGLATHLALAYVHFSDFKIGSDLFELFWNKQNSKCHEEFISFVGRHAISRDNAAGFISENKIDLEKIKNLWDWVLETIEDPDVFSGFGFWIDKEQNVFEDSRWLADHIERTLKKSKGETNWDYGLIKSLPALAEKAPKETLGILRVYLLDQYKYKPESFRNSVYVNDFLSAFEIIYKNKENKEDVYALINELILTGSSRFWRLKEVII